MVFDPNDGLPLVGVKRAMLGVRPLTDVTLIPARDLNGNVVLDRKGLSVNADWRSLPPHLIPIELDTEVNGASGVGMKVFVHGNGAFAEGAVTDKLELMLKSGSLGSGVVCPTALVSLVEYQSNLEATRADWVEDPS